MSNKIDFNKDWRFSILNHDDSSGAPDELTMSISSGKPVTIPHTPKLEPLLVNDMWQGICCYHKQFHVEKSFAGKKVFIEFEGVMTVADVWINGNKCLTHKGGYLPFIIDASDLLHYGDTNTIAVKVDNMDHENIPPGKPLKELDFCWYGGIYRNVNLIIKDRLHITNPIYANRVAGGGIFVTYPSIENDSAVVQIQTDVQNDDLQEQHFSIENTITDTNGKVISRHESAIQSLNSKENTNITTNMELKSPLLWSPETPNLYHLETVISVDQNIIDKELTRIGIRRFEISSDGFYINGNNMYLRGTNRHQEYPFLGYALSDNANYRDARLIKEAGFDMVRLSHYPQSPAFLDACDELGILVINAIPGWQFYNAGEFSELMFRDSREMIRRDRNHPSVVLWETSLNETYTIPDEQVKQLHDIVHEELPNDQAFSCGWKDQHYDIFIPARQHTDGPDFWDNWQNGKKAIFTAEYGDFEYLFHDYTRSNFEQTKARPKSIEASSRQARADGEKRLLQQAFNFQESHNQNHICKAMIGDANWVFADYNRGCANDQCESGVVDIFRLPKFAYYFYRSQRDADYPAKHFTAGPMVFIANYWHEHSADTVKVFSNCDEVELLLNGKSLGKRKPDTDSFSQHLPHPPVTFCNINYEKGDLKAIGFVKEAKVAEHTRITPETPHAIELIIETQEKALIADGADSIFLHAIIMDKNGTQVPDANNKVTFNIEGDAKLIGENPTEAKAGIATVLLQSGIVSSTIKISASALGLITSNKIIITQPKNEIE